MHKTVTLLRAHQVVTILLLGPAGAGKGTMATILALLLSKQKARVITTSAVIKKYLGDNSPLGEKFRANKARLSAEQGVITKNYDDDIILEATALEMSLAVEEGVKVIILDGFARALLQMKHAIMIPRLIAVNLPLTLDESLARAAKRTKDRLDEGLSPRDDDKPNRVKERFKVFEADTGPSLRLLYRARRSDVIEIESGKKVREKIKAILKPLYPNGIPAEIMSPFDDPTSKVYDEVVKVEGLKINPQLHAAFRARRGLVPAHPTKSEKPLEVAVTA